MTEGATEIKIPRYNAKKYNFEDPSKIKTFTPDICCTSIMLYDAASS